MQQLILCPTRLRSVSPLLLWILACLPWAMVAESTGPRAMAFICATPFQPTRSYLVLLCYYSAAELTSFGKCLSCSTQSLGAWRCASSGRAEASRKSPSGPHSKTGLATARVTAEDWQLCIARHLLLPWRVTASAGHVYHAINSTDRRWICTLLWNVPCSPKHRVLSREDTW